MVPFILVFVPILAIVALLIFINRTFFSRQLKSVANKQVVITGGSSGIGKALAIAVAKQGAHVTILARDVAKLNKACEEISKHAVNKDQKINSFSVDVSNYDDVEKVLKNIDINVGQIFMLANCAGFAISRKLEDTEPAEILQQMKVNYLGTAYPIRAIVSEMKARNEGIIILTSSQAGLLGIFGLAAYSGSKFALRGFAEALDMEVRSCNISVTVALPPDTDTPGFALENQGKPKETLLISESADLYQPDQVASQLLKDALRGEFLSSVGFESFMLTTLCGRGMTPALSLFQLIYQSVLMGPFRLIAHVYLTKFHRIIKEHHLKNE